MLEKSEKEYEVENSSGIVSEWRTYIRYPIIVAIVHPRLVFFFPREVFCKIRRVEMRIYLKSTRSW